MRKRDKKYADEYLVNPSASRYSSDSVVYIGKWYYFIKDETVVKRTKIILFIISVLNMALFAVGGLWETEASFTPYVFLPYIIAFLPIALSIGTTATALSFEKKITHKQYDKKILVQKAYSYALIVICTFTLICNLVMYFLKDDIVIGEDIVFSLCVVLITVLSAVSLKLQKNMKCLSDY